MVGVLWVMVNEIHIDHIESGSNFMIFFDNFVSHCTIFSLLNSKKRELDTKVT